MYPLSGMHAPFPGLFRSHEPILAGLDQNGALHMWLRKRVQQ